MSSASLNSKPELSRFKLEQRLADALDQSPSAIFFTDARGAFEFANKAFCRSRGCSPQEVCDQRCRDFWTHHLTGGELSVMWSELVAGRPWKTEARFTQADGQDRWEEVQLSALRDDAGQLAGLVGSLSDITQRRQTELALREHQERLRRILEAAYDAIMILDEEGKVRLWNPAASRIYGYSVEEAMGKNITELVALPRDLEAIHRAFAEFRVSGQPGGYDRTTELMSLRKDHHEIVVEMSLSSFKFDDRWLLLAIGRDVTDRKKAEMEKAMLLTSLEEALGNLKTLRGLVPICASCKKIRDDTGFWSQVESYVEAHSEAKFSHGICPECIRKLYPEFASAIEAEQGAPGQSDKAGAEWLLSQPPVA